MKRSKLSYKYILIDGRLKRDVAQKVQETATGVRGNVHKKRKICVNDNDNAMIENAKKSGEANPLQFEKDPLKINSILATVFDFCSVETLRNCRLVCNRWRDVSLHIWMKRAALCLGFGPSQKQKPEGFNNLKKEYMKLLQAKRDALDVKRYLFRAFRIREEDVRKYLNEPAETPKPVSDFTTTTKTMSGTK